jgi:aryl-alcohol dehydrogenase-like predicted oxidoreductase
MTASSPNYSLAEQVEEPWGEGCVTVSGPAQTDARAWYIANQMPLFAYSSLARGLFSGRVSRSNLGTSRNLLDRASTKAYLHEVNLQRLDRVEAMARDKGCTVPQLALAYVLHSPLNVFPLVGAASGDEFAENARALELGLTLEELAWLDLRHGTV